LSAVFTPSSSGYAPVTVTVPIVVLGPGVTVIGSQLYCVGGSSTNDVVQVTPAGASSTGSSGVKVQTLLNGVNAQTTYSQSFTAINVFLQGGNENVQFASGLTMNAVITAGNGNNNVQTGAGNSVITLGSGSNNVQAGNGTNVITASGKGNDNVSLGSGNDSVQLGDGNNLVVMGNGNDSVQLGNGNNLVFMGNGNDSARLGNGNNVVAMGNGNDNITVGNGNNVVATGNGQDNITVGNGNNLIVTGLGQHTISKGSGCNIFINNNAALEQSIVSLSQVFADWIQFSSAADELANCLRAL
jgi:Ca2+-binding RTX toxin-like protein